MDREADDAPAAAERRLLPLAGMMRMPSLTMRLNLTAKFNLLTIFMIVFSTAVISLFLIRSDIMSYSESLLKSGRTIAHSIARSSAHGITTGDEAYLRHVFEGLKTDPDIAYVVLLTADRRVLASSIFGSTSALPDAPAGGAEGTGTVVLGDIAGRKDGQRFIEIRTPVFASESGEEGAVLGYLRLGLSREGAQKRIRGTLASVAVGMSLIILIGSGLTMLLTRRITTPLKSLTAATQDISEGKFDFPIEIRARDEVADLAGSLDTMRERLRLYHLQVAERTAELTATNERLQGEINARESAEDQIEHDALHDALTGLPNRALFMERLSHVMVMAHRRKDFSYAVLFVDLDRFKVINESLGHICGDLLLIALGHRLMTCLRPHDTVARLGGDEFAILLEDTMGMGNATYIAERIAAAMAAPFTFSKKREVFATASIGIALSARGYQRPDEVLRDAHTAMYQAKSGGRAQYVVFEPGMHAHAVERLRLETDLRRAVERNEFTVFYQPIISLSSNRIAGFEALVRWRHPERGLLEPGEFVPMAEETGIIVSIDRLVIHEACRQMREWMERRSGKELAFISANISNKQMGQPDLVDFIAQTLMETGLPPRHLKLEITENVIISNPEEAVAVLHKLKMLGVRLYIDDFGTGYSSLSYLHLLPIDGFKIDRSFIQRMGDHGENLEIVKTIMLLGRDLNLDIIAEGLETESQVDQIKSLKCEYGQGFLFSKPVDSDGARELFEISKVAYSE